MAKRSLWLFISATILGGIGFALYSVWPTLFPRVIAVAPLVSDCNLRQGPCTGHLPEGGKVMFAIEPRSLPLLQPLTLEVRIQGPEATYVEIDFAGTDMNMGYNRVRLNAVGPGAWRGQATLPVCVRNRMTWEAKVLLATDLGLMAAPFRFDTFSPAARD
jgi:hypothetical protein